MTIIAGGNRIEPPPNLNPRDLWAGGLEPVGPLVPEDDVRFLLVHHTATPNGYGAEGVGALLRSIFGYHTGTKGWPDIAYNFMVDAHGEIWETRAGSIAGPIRGDATGGSQGHAVLCCFLGDHTIEPPTPAAIEAMTALLAWQADRYAIDLADGSLVDFVSRGSGRWPEGSPVTTEPIAGHRDMSHTECPGDAVYDLIDSVLRPDARARLEAAEPVPTTAEAPTTTTEIPTTTEATTTSTPSTSGTAPISTTGRIDATGSIIIEPQSTGGRSRSAANRARPVIVGTGATLVTGTLGALIWLRRRRSGSLSSTETSLDDDHMD